MREKVGVHLEQRARLENKRGQRDLGQVHSDADLCEQMGYHALLIVYVD